MKIAKKKYGYASLTGPVNQYEQSRIYLNVLLDFKQAVSSAIQFHKDLRIVEKD